MADTYYEACKSQLMVDATTVRNVRSIRTSKSSAIKKFGTSSTNCAKAAIAGAKDINITFGVVLSAEENIEDLIDVGDAVTIVVKYYTPDGTLAKTRSVPVVISNMSDDINIDDGGEITVTVEATSSGDETLT